MKKVLVIVAYAFLSIFLFAVIYFAADAILSRIPASVNIKQLPKRYTVYILSNDVHTDIVFPTTSDIIDWRTIFPLENNKSVKGSNNFIAIGWGDKGFYLNTPEWKDLTAKTALVAALGIGETALHVTYYDRMEENELCYKVSIDSLQFDKLKNHVLDSYDKAENGLPINIKTTAQYGDFDAFYEAKGSYSMFYSCNTWANEGLKKANMPAGIWTVFDKGVLRHYGY